MGAELCDATVAPALSTARSQDHGVCSGRCSSYPRFHPSQIPRGDFGNLWFPEQSLGPVKDRSGNARDCHLPPRPSPPHRPHRKHAVGDRPSRLRPGVRRPGTS